MKKYFVFGFIVCGIWTGTQSLAEAAGAVIPLSPTHTLLTYTFTETFLNRDVTIPVLASTTASHSPLRLSYSLIGTESVRIQNITAAVLSSNPILNGGYDVRAGTRNSYMLTVLVTHDTDARPVGLTLTSLPFLITEGGNVTGHSVKQY